MYRRWTAIPDELVRAAAAGDQSAQVRLYQEIEPLVSRLLVSLVGANVAVEELGGEITAEVLLSLPSFRWQSRFATWAHAVVVRAARRWRRRARLRRLALQASQHRCVPPAQLPPDDLLAQREEVLAAAEAISRLPARLQLCVFLIDVVGFEPTEVAAVVGGTAHAVRSSAHKGRIRVRKDLLRRGLLTVAGGAASATTGRSSGEPSVSSSCAGAPATQDGVKGNG